MQPPWGPEVAYVQNQGRSGFNMLMWSLVIIIGGTVGIFCCGFVVLTAANIWEAFG